MPNRRPGDHIGAFNFRMEIEGITEGPARYVGGLTTRTDVLAFKDGAERIVRQRPGRSRCDNLVIQRGYTNNDELYDWHEQTRQGVLSRKSGSIIILGDDAATEITRFNFFEAWPCRWSLLPLDAEEGTALIEEIELAIEFIEKG